MIVVVGSVNADLVVRGPRLPRPGETVIGGQFYQAGGGKGANQAVAAARLAATPVVFVGAVGDDLLGHQMRDGLVANGVDCRYLLTKPGYSTGVAVIMVDHQGQNAISVAPGANAHLTVADVDRAADALFPQAQVVLVSLEVPSQTARRALERARHAGAVTILNPAPAHPDWSQAEWLRHVDWLTPNESEAALLAGGTIGDKQAIEQCGRWLCAQGPKHVCITCGADGAVFIGGSQLEWLPAFKVEAVDTTAAGDAFNGALAVALAEGKSAQQALRWAAAAAALSVTRAGAQPSLPDRHAVEAFLRAHPRNLP